METYPTETEWTLWFHNVNDSNWEEESFQKLCQISSLKDYWEVMNTMPPITAGMFFLMKEDVFPRWEDINNIDGGYWSFRITKKESDEVWKELFAHTIGHVLTKDPDDMGLINGISVSPKINNCIIKIWNNDVTKNDVNILNENMKGISITDSLYRKHQEQADFIKVV